MSERLQIGVISDTHGLLRPEALAALRGSDLIIHAGDVGPLAIVTALREIAPVTVVRGNTDVGTSAGRFSKTEVVACGGRLLYVLHDLGDLDLDPVAAGFRVVISGHSHHPDIHTKDGVLYLNPGSAGPRRFSLPITVALIHLSSTTLDACLVPLEGSA